MKWYVDNQGSFFWHGLTRCKCPSTQLIAHEYRRDRREHRRNSICILALITQTQVEHDPIVDFLTQVSGIK